MAGGYWLREDTIWTDKALVSTPTWNHAMFIGRDDLYKRRTSWDAEPFIVRVEGDEGAPTYGQMYGGWVGSDFKIFDEWGGSVTLHQTSPRSIEWRYVPKADPALKYYPNRLRKCTR